MPRINEATDTDLKVIEESGGRDEKRGKENKWVSPFLRFRVAGMSGIGAFDCHKQPESKRNHDKYCYEFDRVI